MSGHEIERLMKIGEGSLAFDSPDNARNVEQFNCRAEERFPVVVESKDVMTEMFADIKEVSGARSQIENAQRRRAVEPEVLRALDVNVDPINDVFETIDLGRARPKWVFVPQFFELEPIDVIQHPAFVDRVAGPPEMFGRAREELFREKFAKLA